MHHRAYFLLQVHSKVSFSVYKSPLFALDKVTEAFRRLLLSPSFLLVRRKLGQLVHVKWPPVAPPTVNVCNAVVWLQIIFTCVEGAWYLCDVGFGSTGITEPLLLLAHDEAAARAANSQQQQLQPLPGAAAAAAAGCPGESHQSGSRFRLVVAACVVQGLLVHIRCTTCCCGLFTGPCRVGQQMTSTLLY